MQSSIRLIFAEDQKVYRKLLIPILEQYAITTVGEADNARQLGVVFKMSLAHFLKA